MFWTCEQADRTCSAVANVVSGLNWTVIHCWSSAASILAQPPRRARQHRGRRGRDRDSAHSSGRRRRPCTPTLYGLARLDWLTGPLPPYGDVDGDDGVDDGDWEAAMASLIEDYALIGDMQTAALVGRDGSVDWLCLPRFDSDACFAALLGDEHNGSWRICPTVSDGPVDRRGEVSRQYQGDSLILETTWQHDERHRPGHRLHAAARSRRRRCWSGSWRASRARSRWSRSCGCGSATARSCPGCGGCGNDIRAIAGPDSVCFHSPVRSVGQNMAHQATFDVQGGRPGAVRADLEAVPPAARPLHRRRRGAGGDARPSGPAGPRTARTRARTGTP